jgi:hypothetical protein
VSVAEGASEEAMRLHHAWPKYLGGAEKQDLVPLSKSLHDSYHSGLDRFTLRGQTKVDGQWKLYGMIHNIEKLAHHGYGR